uniref:Neur_chan_LBD domain-containing protein n=1 Tax=Caenorhabditis tropicalis TaxID=1561998 RepID=A0A1I7UMM8_9PELO
MVSSILISILGAIVSVDQELAKEPVLYARDIMMSIYDYELQMKISLPISIILMKIERKETIAVEKIRI